MAQTFEYSLAGDPALKLTQIKAAAATKGVFFSGDLRSGQFSGVGISGSYSISGSTITVTVNSKPVFVSWAYIDAQLRGFIER
jgi:hypothetical protein